MCIVYFPPEQNAAVRFNDVTWIRIPKVYRAAMVAVWSSQVYRQTWSSVASCSLYLFALFLSLYILCAFDISSNATVERRLKSKPKATASHC